MPGYRRKPLCSIAPLFLIDGVINLILCGFSPSATGERCPACRAAGGREPASGALRRSQAWKPKIVLGFVDGTLLKGSPLRGLHGAEMASTVTSEERSDCEPGAASAAGSGRGR
ncbi:hypothetical protein AFK69_13950 [Xenorhabdus sp. GDc328]|nr:hypothetical protein AAY47_13845 [Xenorhabdus griffiniae]KOP32681.1 hypothetical protein AFK69_13950 [Xenorhabdus sp. GDc328]